MAEYAYKYVLSGWPSDTIEKCAAADMPLGNWWLGGNRRRSARQMAKMKLVTKIPQTA